VVAFIGIGKRFRYEPNKEKPANSAMSNNRTGAITKVLHNFGRASFTDIRRWERDVVSGNEQDSKHAQLTQAKREFGQDVVAQIQNLQLWKTCKQVS
jgi:hypothetical protein